MEPDGAGGLDWAIAKVAPASNAADVNAVSLPNLMVVSSFVGNVGNHANAIQRALETIVPRKQRGIGTQRVFAAMPPRRRRETRNGARERSQPLGRQFSSRGKSAASGRVPGRAPSVPCWWRHSAIRPAGRK